ncbi:MAG: AsmA family protein [Lentisphaerales bacterium]|nr:AsmA family protein [Lentisphaerales bacterium]
MSEENNIEPPVKKKGWLKILIILFSLFVLVVAGIFFYVNSASFIRGQVFSRIQNDLNQPVTAGDMSFSVFSGIEIDNFTLGDDPLLKADKIKVNYELMPLLSGELVVHEMLLDNASMNVVINRDGKLNIISKRVEDLSKAAKKTTSQSKPIKTTPKKESAPKKSTAEAVESPLKSIALKNIKIKNLNLRLFKDHDKSEKVVEFKLKNFNFDLPELVNGGDFVISLNGALECIAGSKFKLTEGAFEGSLKSGLSADFKPQALDATFNVRNLNAQSDGLVLPVKDFDFKSLISMAADELKIEQLKLSTVGNDKPSEVVLSGIVNTINDAVSLNLNVNNVNASLLDLASPFVSGNKNWLRWQKSLKEVSDGQLVGFGSTVINYSAKVDKSEGNPVKLSGQFTLQDLPLVKQAGSKQLSKFGVNLNHDIELNPDTQKISVKKLSFLTKENDKVIVDVKSTGPIVIDGVNKTVKTAEGSPLTIKLAGLNADYAKPFIDEKDLQGLKSARLSMTAELSTPSDSQVKFYLKELLINKVAVEQDQLEISDLSVKTSSIFLLDNQQNLSIEDLTVGVVENGSQLLSTALAGEVDLKSFTSEIKVNELAVKPGVELFLPEDLKNQFGVKNINLLGQNIELSYENGIIATTGQLSSSQIGLGGQMFNDATISQKTSFDLTLNKDKNVEIKKIGVGVSSNRFSDIAIDITGKLAPPVEGKVSESQINIDVLTVINADQLLGLLRKQTAQQQAKSTQKPVAEKQNKAQAPQPAPVNKPPIKATLTSNIKGVVLEGQKVSEITTKAILENEDLTLEKLDMFIGETLLHIEGAANIGQKKKADLAVSSKGFIDISPVNAFINKGSDRQVSGLVEIASLKVTTEGQANDDFLNNLVATGVINMKDIKAQKYANVPSVLSTTADLVLGVNPDNIHFTEGKFDVAVKDKVVTLNECRFKGKSFMVNPTGTLALTDTAYEINMNSEAGFGGGQLIQTVMGAAGGQLMKQLAGKSKSIDRFNQSFQYSDALKLFTLKDVFKYQKSIPLKRNSDTSLTSDFLSSVITYAAEVGKMKNDEIGRLQRIASGKGNVLEDVLGLGIDQYNKKNKIDQQEEGKEGESAKKKGLFDQLIDIGINEVDKREKKKAKKKAEKEGTKPEEEKKPDSKKQILEGLRGLFN